MRGYFAIAAVSAVCASSFAEITYTVGSGPTENRIAVTIQFVANSDSTELQIPNWAPGSYRYDDNWKKVQNFKSTVNGKEIEAAVDKQNEGKIPTVVTWKLKTAKGQPVTVSYDMPVSFGDEVGHFSGPSTYMYIVGRKNEKCVLKFNFAKDTPIAVGLNPGKNGTWVAPDYDVLADNPVSYGNFLLDTVTVNRKTHSIVYRGAAKKLVNREYVKRACKFIGEMQSDFFRNTPYDKYVWHFAVNDSPDGAGGLEHLSSTQISMGSGVGPGVVGVYSHEFFHLWNVKRIRSKALGPFDYQNLPTTGALWWLEGVTDYYAHTLLGRYGWYGLNEREPAPIPKMYATLAQNVRGVRANKERFNISPYDSSFRVREASGGRGNSQGLGVSYYNTGFVCGFVLDVELLDKTNGKHSLDSVERALYDICKNNKPGFEEDEIRKQLIRFGGADMGPFYDQWIMKPGELPVEAALAKIGKRMSEIDEKFGQIPIILRTSFDDKALRIAQSDIPELKNGDIVVEVNGQATTGDSNSALTSALRSLTASAKAGDTWTVKTKDGKSVQFVIKEATRKKLVIEDVPGATPEQIRLRKIFESKKRN